MPVLGIIYGTEDDRDDFDRAESEVDEVRDEDEVTGGLRTLDDAAEMDMVVRLNSFKQENAQPALVPSSIMAAAVPAPDTNSTTASSRKRPPPATPVALPDTKKPRHDTSEPVSATKHLNSTTSEAVDLPAAFGQKQDTSNEAGIDTPSQPVTTTTTDGQVMTTAATNVAAMPNSFLDDDDDDDFVIPELNMDPDTEEEEDEDDVDQ